MTNFKPVTFATRFNVLVPEHRARWDGWYLWEKERFFSMESHLKPASILFDIGSEQGDVSAVYAQFVGGMNMCLFESNPANWPNIRLTFEANMLANPMACFVGLVGDKSATPALDYANQMRDGWPECAWREELQTEAAYRYLSQHTKTTAQTRLDDWCCAAKIMPDALTIDVEGAELRVLMGAEKLLRERKLLIWVSIHPRLMQEHCLDKPKWLMEFMADCGYKSELLADDHEEHHRFWKE